MPWKNEEKKRLYDLAWKAKDRKRNPDRYRNYKKKDYEKRKEVVKKKVRDRYWQEPEKHRERRRRYYEANRERILAYEKKVGFKRYLKRLYGITPEFRKALGDAQDGKCLICGQKKRLVLDHDHRTGRIRGMLCIQCNGKLGWFEKRSMLILDYIFKEKGNEDLECQTDSHGSDAGNGAQR